MPKAGVMTALGAAVSKGYVRIVQLLLDRGADIHVQAGEYWTVLSVAAYRGDEKIVQLLLDRGANTRSGIQANGWTRGLEIAASHGHNSIVRLLLGTSTDINAVQNMYGTALGMAARWGNILIQDYGAEFCVLVVVTRLPQVPIQHCYMQRLSPTYTLILISSH